MLLRLLSVPGLKAILCALVLMISFVPEIPESITNNGIIGLRLWVSEQGFESISEYSIVMHIFVTIEILSIKDYPREIDSWLQGHRNSRGRVPEVETSHHIKDVQ